MDVSHDRDRVRELEQRRLRSEEVGSTFDEIKEKLLRKTAFPAQMVLQHWEVRHALLFEENLFLQRLGRRSRYIFAGPVIQRIREKFHIIARGGPPRNEGSPARAASHALAWMAGAGGGGG